MKKKDKNKNLRHFPSQSLIATINAKNTQKAKFYRSHLEPLIGKRVIVTGVIAEWQESKICNKWGARFCFETMKVLNYKCPDTEHLWINCDYKFLQRNKLKVGDTPVLKGTFYEYCKNDMHGKRIRNIGFRLDYVLDKEQSVKYKAG